MPWVGIFWNDCGVNWHHIDFRCKQRKLLLPFKAEEPIEYICNYFSKISPLLAYSVWSKGWGERGERELSLSKLTYLTLLFLFMRIKKIGAKL